MKVFEMVLRESENLLMASSEEAMPLTIQVLRRFQHQKKGRNGFVWTKPFHLLDLNIFAIFQCKLERST